MAETTTKKRSVFETLNAINVNEHTETKNGLTYLSWAWAWAEAKKAYPLARFTIYENANGWNYHTDGRTAWVKTGVTIEDVEYIEYLPVMDMRNRSIMLDNITSFDVNKAIQRSLTKALARHGLGLYIYAGEDLPEDAEAPAPAKAKAAPAKPAHTPTQDKPVDDATYWALVKAEAGGRKTKQGMSPYEYLRDVMGAPATYLAQFTSHVDQYRTANPAK